MSISIEMQPIDNSSERTSLLAPSGEANAADANIQSVATAALAPQPPAARETLHRTIDLTVQFPSGAKLIPTWSCTWGLFLGGAIAIVALSSALWTLLPALLFVLMVIVVPCIFKYCCDKEAANNAQRRNNFHRANELEALAQGKDLYEEVIINSWYNRKETTYSELQEKYVKSKQAVTQEIATSVVALPRELPPIIGDYAFEEA